MGMSKSVAAADQDLQIRGGGRGVQKKKRGGDVHPNPEIRGGSQRNFSSALRGLSLV